MSFRIGDKKVFLRIRYLLIFTFGIIITTGCVTLVDPETTQEYSKSAVAVIKQDQSVGQTFISRRARFNRIDLWMQTDTSGQMLLVEVFHQLGDPKPVFTREIKPTNGKVRIDIHPQDDSENEIYYLRLSSNSGKVILLGRDEDNYQNGTAVINEQPIDADLAFRVSYEYNLSSVLEDIRGLLANFNILVPLSIILLLPGWLLLDFLNLNKEYDFGEQIAVSLGISLSIIPLLMLWSSTIGLSWGPISVWMISIVLIGLLIWRIFLRFKGFQNNSLGFSKTESLIDILEVGNHHLQEINKRLTDLILLAIFFLTIFTRIVMVRDLASPSWVDPIHHGTITRLILENGGLPETYEPYLPTQADYYHFGFHSTLSTFIWLTGLEIHDAMLILGQILNALIVFAIYLLTKTLTKSKSAALTGALIAGIFTLMPAYYTSWGRYTHLTGLLVLPVGFNLFTKAIDIRSSTFQKRMFLILAGVTIAGLFLIHYRVTAFFGLLILAFLVTQISTGDLLKNTGKFILSLLLSICLVLPWLPGLFKNLLLPMSRIMGSGSSGFSQIPLNFLKPGLGVFALVLAVIGLVFGLIRMKHFTITIILWTSLMYLLANLKVFGFPGSGFVNPVSFEISLFMPIAVIGGYAIGGTYEVFDKYLSVRWKYILTILIVCLGCVSAIIGVQRLSPTLNPRTFLSRNSDFPSITWIYENIPENETIMINPTGWGYGLYMGGDGGYWISPLTGHQTMPPPVLYGLGNRNDVENINQLIEKIIANGNNPQALWELMRTEKINYVYLGVRGGDISPRALSKSIYFKTLYQKDGTWVFEVQNP